MNVILLIYYNVILRRYSLIYRFYFPLIYFNLSKPCCTDEFT